MVGQFLTPVDSGSREIEAGIDNVLFISHSSQDDAFVRDLRSVLGLHGQDVWINSRELRGGDPLCPEIREAIECASAYAIVVSPDSLQSNWVGRELNYALRVQKERGKDKFPVIPLSLDGTKLGVLEELFGDEPVYIPVSSGAGGIEAAIDPILVALGKRLPADIPATPQPKAEPLEELVLELTDLKFLEEDGVSRVSAKARLVYQPATSGQREVAGKQTWRFVAPIGPVEADDLRWYLEKYAIWPSKHFQDRAHKVEDSLVQWGQLLHEAAMPIAYTANVTNAWSKVDAHAGRRFSVLVDATLETGASEAEVNAAREAATVLLGLPWELLDDGDGFLFQGAKPVRVRRRLPNTRDLDVPVVATPIRILLVTARPEDQACGYIDHRASALPLVEAVEALGGMVRINVLDPPTLGALREELDRAHRAYEPYHVVHFDGHGVYDRRVGLGGLCFEDPRDADKLEKRRHNTVYTSDLGPLLRDHRIPLVFLEACQTAQAEKASESVASELLRVGVASVIAMSHSVLVETARRFVEAFYAALACGSRVGDAMLEGQHKLKDDTFRGRIFGVGELRLQDWFVPVLFQEREDPQLFTATPTPQTQKDLKVALKVRLGELPEEPETGFIGRSRELLALQRLLRKESYAVVRGQGGEGKTALAAEFARWMVRSQQVERAAFVCVEGIEKNPLESVLDQLGHQLVKPKFSTQIECCGDIGRAEMEIARVLAEQSTLIVVDNMESILLPPYIETPEALSEEASSELEAILKLCAQLNKNGDTRLVFTSREQLPAPFGSERNRRELRQLDREDAVKLVERVLNEEADDVGTADDVAREAIEQLVDAVHCHARSLALLAPALRSQGVDATRESLVELMAEMEKKFPGSREKSVFASVELSLRRMSPGNRDRVKALGVFHGGVSLGVLHVMMGWEEAVLGSLVIELIATGLATPNPHRHLTLNPALCPYLRAQLEPAERETLVARWNEAMCIYAKFLAQQQGQNTEVAATLTPLELPNLFAALEQVQHAGDAQATVGLAISIYNLLRVLGRPRLVERAARVRDSASAALGETWSHVRFQAQTTLTEQQVDGGALREAYDGARQLLNRARTAGEAAYPEAGYDLAMAYLLLARVLKKGGASEQALPLIGEARERFEAVGREIPGCGAESMASACVAEEGDNLMRLGRFDEAAAAYEDYVSRAERLGRLRDFAVGRCQLGTVRQFQRRYQEALNVYEEACERFTMLGEPDNVALSWYRIAEVYWETGQPEAAEDAYRKSLEISVGVKNAVLQAVTLAQLGRLYCDDLGRLEEAVRFMRQAADQFVQIGDLANEGTTRSNLGEALRKLGHLDMARPETYRAIGCGEQSGHAGQPWVSWNVLADIEADAGDSAAAEEARQKAVECYLTYRRDGGENHSGAGRLVFDVTKRLHNDGCAATVSFLQGLATRPDATRPFRIFIEALQAIVAGSRDPSLADAPELDYTMSAEVLFLIETLEKSR